jgi:DNA-binding TFAR19-related protein (PDSD5 family)
MMKKTAMRDAGLEAIRKKKLRELKKQLASRQQTKLGETEATKPEQADSAMPEETDAMKVLDGIFKGRAWEVFNSASVQYPSVMARIKSALARAALSGRLKEITGEQLFLFLRQIGLRVRLNTTISFAEHGKLKSLGQRLREKAARA